MAFINQQPSWVFSQTSINGVSSSSSSKPNLLQSTSFFQIRSFRTLTISASSSNDSFSNGEEPDTTDPVKLAFARARQYKKSKQEKTQNPKSSENKSDGAKEMSDFIKLAMEKAKEYRKIIGEASSSNSVGGKEKDSGLEEVDSRNSGYGVSEKSVNEKDGLSVPSIAFVGLNFSGKKKSKGLPAGLAPLVETYTNGDLPEVEYIVGDASKFGPRKSSQPDSNTADDSDVHKPKYGGGKTIRAGDKLETEEEKAAKEAHTRKLLAAYKSKTGLAVDPKLKPGCEKTFKDGDDLMDTGKLKQASPYYGASSLNDDSSIGEEPDTTDPVKLAFARARLYKKSKQEKTQNQLPDFGKVGNGNGVKGSESKSDGAKEMSDFIKLAMEKAKEYKKNIGEASSSNSVGGKEKDSGLEEVDSRNSGYGVSEKSVNEKDELSVPSIAFVGLNFSGKKKSRGLPAGLTPLVETYTNEDLPEVEYIVGDASKFGPRKSSQPDSNTADDSDVHKPKYGGGKTIRAGEKLETEEEKAAKEAHTRKLLAAYKSKTRLAVDPKLKPECEKTFKDGDDLMDTGKLKQASPYYGASSLNDDSSIGEEPDTTDPVKLAFARARLYKKSKQEKTQNQLPDSGKVGNGNGVKGSESKSDGAKEMSDFVKLAMEKAKEYKKNIGEASSSNNVGGKEKDSGLEEVDSRNSGYGVSEKSVNEKDKISVPSIAFVGLNFSDTKKSRGLPAGLAPLVETYTDEDLPEVEYIVGDASKFGPRKSSQPDSNTGNDSDVYKPKTFKDGDDLMDTVKLKQALPYYDASSLNEDSSNGEEPATTDPVKLAFARASLYKKSKQEQTQNPLPDSGKVGNGNGVAGSVSKIDGAKEMPDSVKRAMERAKEYKKNKGAALGSSSSSNNSVEAKEKGSGLEEVDSRNSGYGVSEKSVNEKDKISVPSIAFVGLNFSDKKSRGLPAGLAPLVETYTDEDLPEVEFIVGDASKFGPRNSSQPDSNTGDDSDVYKPKVSTWGVFPRPSNISKAYGGGKTIRVGEELETEEEKAAKKARTRKLLASYKSKTGLVVDPKLKAECEKTLKDGDDLMDTGKLKQALPYYEKVMKELPFQTELHGLAALQWSICLDSLTRQAEAQVMYEKLQYHPNALVKKKASQFLFAFEAMKMLKVTSSSPPSTTEGYRSYFEAFVEDKTIAPLKVETAKGDEEEEKEGTLVQALPYMILLVSPILLVLLIVVQKHI